MLFSHALMKHGNIVHMTYFLYCRVCLGFECFGRTLYFLQHAPANSPCVADSALVSLLAQCSSLQHLDVSRCSNVSLDGAHTCPYRANMTIHMMHLQHVSTYTGVWVALQGAAAAAAGIATGIAGGGAGAGGGPLTVAAYGCPGGEAARERLLARVAASNMQQLLAGSARVVTMLL